MQGTQPKYFFKFTQAYNDNGTVYYIVQIHIKGEEQQKITIKTRYSQLRSIHEKCMLTELKNQLPNFPPKKIVRNTKDQFIQKRKKQLQNYYNTLSKTIEIQKLPDLAKYIDSHRQKKLPQDKKNNNDQYSHKLQIRDKIQNQLKPVFQEVYKSVLHQLLDLKDNFTISPMPHDDSSKRLTLEIQQLKPQYSQLLSSTQTEGIDKNQLQSWLLLCKIQQEQSVTKAKNVLLLYNALQKQIRNQHRENIVLAR